MSHAKRPRGRLKRRLHLLVLCRNDFAAAEDAAKFLATPRGFRPSNPLCHAIHAGFVVAYGRPFKVNDDLGTLAGSHDRYGDAVTDKTHRDLIDLRDRSVAHNDASTRSVVVVPKGSSVTPGSAPSPHLTV